MSETSHRFHSIDRASDSSRVSLRLSDTIVIFKEYARNKGWTGSSVWRNRFQIAAIQSEGLKPRQPKKLEGVSGRGTADRSSLIFKGSQERGRERKRASPLISQWGMKVCAFPVIFLLAESRRVYTSNPSSLFLSSFRHQLEHET